MRPTPMFGFENMPLVWIAVAIVAAVVELALPTFGFIFVSAGAVVAAIAAWLGASVTVQVGLLLVVLVASLMLIRPRLMSSLGSKGVPSRTEALLGKRGRVTQDVNPTLGTGRVNVGGEDWAASSDRLIASGTDIVVKGADGIVLRVNPVD
jgi:membrane protein implicated in regulation of membrane protease activity